MSQLKTYQKCGFPTERELADYIMSENRAGVTVRDIHKKLGVGYTSLWRTLRKFGLEVVVGHGYLNHGFADEQSFVDYLKVQYEIKSIPEIAAELGVTTETVQSYYFPKYSINKRTSSETLRLLAPAAELNSAESSVVSGMLLGDGGVYTSARCFSSCIHYACHYMEVLNDLRLNVLPRLGWCLKTNKYFDKRTKKTYTNYSIQSHAYKDFTDLRDKWYPEGKKIVPRDIELTPEACYWWYLGDGSSGNSSLKLCTNGFTEDDVKFLVSRMPVECTYYMSKSGPMIHIIKRAERRKFLDYIGPCRHDCYAHRWIVNDSDMKPAARWNFNATAKTR